MNVFLFLATLGISIAVLRAVYRHWPRSAEGQFLQRWMAFTRSRPGMALDDLQAEYEIRLAAVRVRRIATDLTLQSPGNYEAIIAKAVKSEALRLGARHKGLGRGLVEWGSSSPMADILYPSAVRAVYSHMRAAGKQRIAGASRRSAVDMEDSIAALTVLR